MCGCTKEQRVSTWARFHNNQIGAEGIVSMRNVIGRVGVLSGMLGKPISLKTEESIVLFII